MTRFLELTFKPFFIVTGAITAAAWLDALLPRWTVEHVQKLAFSADYTTFVRHWGVLVGLAGIFMIVAAFRESWRAPILAYTAIEKGLFVVLVTANASQPYAAGFVLAAAMDALVVVYIVGYFVATLPGARNGGKVRECGGRG